MRFIPVKWELFCRMPVLISGEKKREPLSDERVRKVLDSKTWVSAMPGTGRVTDYSDLTVATPSHRLEEG